MAENVLHLRGGDELALFLAIFGQQRHFDFQTTPQTVRMGLPFAAILNTALAASTLLFVAILYILCTFEHFV